MQTLAGRVVAITGASAGIGAACAEALAPRGVNLRVILNAIAPGLTDRAGQRYGRRRRSADARG